MQYSLHHPESPRTLVYSHSLALLVFVMYTIAALYYWDVAMFCKGYALSFACARMGHVLVSGVSLREKGLVHIRGQKRREFEETTKIVTWMGSATHNYTSLRSALRSKHT